MRSTAIHDADAGPVDSAAYRLGFWVAVLIAVTTAVSFGLALTAVPISGPHCPGSCVTYPFTNDVVAGRFPKDYLWMYPAMLLALLFVALIACLHQLAPASRKVFSLIGLALAVPASTVLLTDYFLQVTVMQPSLVKGHTDGWSMLTQYNSNGVFIALEDLGYLMMGAALLPVAAVVAGPSRIERAIRWLFTGSFVAVVGSLVIVSVLYGTDRQDRFEVPALTVVWSVIIVSGLLLAVHFRRALRQQTPLAGD